mgnify:CR=1 FL=1
MKKVIVLLSICFLSLCSCNNEDENNTSIDLVGIWELKELSIDPGDGSGTFETTKSSLTIEFKNDGTLISTGEMCNVFGEVTEGSNGVYSTENLMIMTTLCQVRFEMSGNDLIWVALMSWTYIISNYNCFLLFSSKKHCIKIRKDVCRLL